MTRAKNKRAVNGVYIGAADVKPTKVGKPANMSMADWTKSVLNIYTEGSTLQEKILMKQAEMALDGNTGSAEFLFDRAYGKPTQLVHNLGDQPKITVQIVNTNASQPPTNGQSNSNGKGHH